MSRQEKIRAYKLAFDGEAGKKVLEDLKGYCGYDAIIPPDDPIKMAFEEGRRAVYIYIKDLVEAKEEEEGTTYVTFG